jgi:hypothetical protein
MLPLLLVLLSGLPAAERILPLQGRTHHVQGLVLDGGAFWVTSVDREAKAGLLLKFDARTGKELARLSSGDGARYHPGGFDLDAGSLWIPAAEYKPRSSAWIERRDRKTGHLLSRFESSDHIGAVAVMPDRLIGANWDAREFYEWTKEGRLLRVRPNPTRWRFQDLKYRDGLLVGAGVAPRGSDEHAVVWLDPETLEVRRTLLTGKTDRAVPFTNEGLEWRGGRLYLMPEDDPTRVFVFALP